MLITNEEQLKSYALSARCWQGIPSVAVTVNGRIFACFYSGTKTEDLGNYCALIYSDDDGKSWSEVVAVAYFGETSRAYDPCVWIDAKNRLWFYYSVSPEQKVFAAVCDNPENQTLIFGEEKEIGGEVLLNKPTVMQNGEWWFPSAVWGKGLMEPSTELKEVYRPLDEREIERKAFCIVSKDEGKSFEKRGGALAKERSYDEHMFLETATGVEVYIRTQYGIGKSVSTDGGYTFGEVQDTGWFAPNTRFFIRRLSSGNLLLVSHQISENPETPRLRTNLTAFLSTDGGKSWKGKLLLDERANVSYPDGQEHNGYIYIIYDRERKTAGEILLAKFMEEDIIAEKIQSKGYLKRTVSVLQSGEK